MSANGFEGLSRVLAERGWHTEYRDVTGSTNDDLKKLARCGLREKTLLVAGCQTAGRGRTGRTFYSPRDTGVYFSMLTGCGYGLVTPRAAVAVAHAITGLTGKSALIKWVNDIFVDGKKVCGILAESNLPEYIVTGIGINITTDDFPPELAGIAGSTGCADMWELVFRTVTEFESLDDTSVIEEYRRLSMITGKRIVIPADGRTGTAVDVNDEGNLIVCFDGGETVILRSGEVSVRPERQD